MPKKNAKNEEKSAVQRFNLPILMTDKSYFDGAYTYMKERFTEEMKRVDKEMNVISKTLKSLYGRTTTVEAGLTSSDDPTSAWDVITNSSLVEDDGDDKMLKLQFDVSQFAPEEVSVRIINDMLVVSATHKENTDSSAVYHEYNREFLLPSGTDPASVESVLSKEGILTVRAPLRLEMSEREAIEN